MLETSNKDAREQRRVFGTEWVQDETSCMWSNSTSLRIRQPRLQQAQSTTTHLTSANLSLEAHPL